MQQTFFWSCEALSACFRFADALMVTGARRRCLSADLKVQRVRQCTVCGCTRVCPRRRHRATIAYKFINRHWCESAAEEFDIAPNALYCVLSRLCDPALVPRVRYQLPVSTDLRRPSLRKLWNQTTDLSESSAVEDDVRPLPLQGACRELAKLLDDSSSSKNLKMWSSRSQSLQAFMHQWCHVGVIDAALRTVASADTGWNEPKLRIRCW